MFKSWNLRKKLIVAFCLSGFIPMLLVAIIAIDRSSVALNNQAYSQLTVVRDMISRQLENSFESYKTQARYYSNQESIHQLFKMANSTFAEHESEVKSSYTLSYQEIRDKVWKYYENDFQSEYKKKNSGTAPENLRATFDALDKTSIYAQYDFIVTNPNNLGEKDKMYESATFSKYSLVHKRIHKDLRDLLTKFGFYDVFFVNESGRIIYSVYKELDFATSLKDGPYKNSNLAGLYNQVMTQAGNDVLVTDLKFYAPSYDFPTSFVAGPIVEEGVKLGAFIIQLPADTINSIMTNNKDWNERVFGKSGEVYLVGKDKFMRSLSRSFHEDKQKFVDNYVSFGGEKAAAKQMADKGITTSIQKVESEAVNLAINGKSSEELVKDYRGVNVLSSFKKVNIEGLDWYVFSEIEEDEVLENIAKTVNFLYLAGAISIICLFFFGAFLSKTISRALSNIAKGIDDNAIENKDASLLLGKRAIELSASTNEQSAATQETMAAMTEISGMLRSTNDKTTATNSLIDEINEKVDGGMKLIAHLSEAMDSILESTKNLAEFESIIVDIEDKTKVINDIVFKTQLLSFNASIEAARAGQHGRGFAVVAEEVGNLADLSGKAALEITGLLGHSTGKVKELVGSNARSVETGKQTSEKVTEFFNEISSALTIMTSNINAIVSATKEQETGVAEVGGAIKELEASTINNSAVADDVNRMASNAEKLVSKMNNLVSQLNGLIEGEKGAGILHTKNITRQSPTSSSRQINDSEDSDENFDYDSFKRAS